MKGVVYKGIEQMAVEERPEPRVAQPTDVVVRITTSAICGSDLHRYHRELPVRDFIIGHEFVGTVQEVGAEVHRFQPGQLVVSPFTTSCGRCWLCLKGWPSQCEVQEIFGIGESLEGAQAQYIRVPLADTTLEPVPPDVPEEQALFLGDIFSTGFFVAEQGGIHPGDTVAVVGCGPVGMFAQMSAQLFGAARVIALDRVPFRLEVAESLGSVPVNAAREDAPARVREMTEGRGADVVLEAVGGDGSALALAFELVRRAGTVSSVGVPTQESFPYPLYKGFAWDITFRQGRCPVKRYIRRLMPLLQNKRVDPSLIVTHVAPLDEATEWYRRFANREPGVLKVLLKP